MSESPRKTLLGLCFQELTALTEAAGESPYRARQLYRGLYAERRSEARDIATLPLDFRNWLAAEHYIVGMPAIERQFASADGTIRYLVRFADGQSVETVWMPEGDGGETGDGSDADPETANAGGGWRRGGFERATICVSSQAGCAVNCRFCMTAQLGLLRNLTPGEIVGQALAVLGERGARVERERINLVFMGQGEPFLNYENFMKAVRLLADPEGVGIPAGRMTVSTSGIVPRIYDFGQEEVRPKLAISLNASGDAARVELMPITRKWNLEQVMAAARAFPLRARERITFEYVLLGGVNDTADDARRVAELVRGLRAKVNLIALNPGPGIAFAPPTEGATREFQQALIQAGIPAYIRKPRGRDIFAACGQLRQTVT